MEKKAELFYYNSAVLLENPCYDEKRNVVWAIEIRKGRIFAISPEDHSCGTYTMPSLVGWIALMPDGRLAAALKDGVYAFDPDNGELTLIAHPETDTRFRYNDGCIDPEGRILVGTKGDSEPMTGMSGCFSISPGGTSKKIITGATTANGMGFSPDGKVFYFIDTPSANIYAYDYDHATGDVSERRVFHTVTDGGLPDGMCVLSDGRICVAECDGGGRVCVYSPDGKIMDTIFLPVKDVTACCVHGNTMYITTAKAKKPRPDEPTAGGMYICEI